MREAFEAFRSDPEGLRTSDANVPGPPSGGANWSLAQQLLAGRLSAWVVPGTRELCLVTQDGLGDLFGSTCTTHRRAIANGILRASLVDPSGPNAEGRRLVVGMAPDGARRVRVHTTGSPPKTVSVANNIFMFRDSMPEPPERVELIR